MANGHKTKKKKQKQYGHFNAVICYTPIYTIVIVIASNLIRIDHAETCFWWVYELLFFCEQTPFLLFASPLPFACFFPYEVYRWEMFDCGNCDIVYILMTNLDFLAVFFRLFRFVENVKQRVSGRLLLTIKFAKWNINNFFINFGIFDVWYFWNEATQYHRDWHQKRMILHVISLHSLALHLNMWKFKKVTAVI